MTRDRIIEKVLNDISIDSRITDGIFDIQNNQHIGYLCEYLMGKGIDSEIIYEFADILLEKGKYPERQAYNRKGILVTFPTPEYKKNAIQAGTHFEKDPTHGNPNIFRSDTPPATEPPQASKTGQSSSTKTNLPISTSTSTPPQSEKSGADTSEPAQAIPNAFTVAAPQQSPQEKNPVEPTKLPEPKSTSPEEKEANKDVIKKMLRGDDYILDEVSKYIMYNVPYLMEIINKKLYDR